MLTTRGVRNASVSLACALLLSFVGSDAARAGTMTVSYGAGGISHEHHTGSWAGIHTGGFTVTLTAFRASPSATSGFISGGTVTYLVLAGGPTHAAGASTFWSAGGGGGAPVIFLPSLTGMFSGLNTAGTAFTGAGGFTFDNVGGPLFTNATLGQFNPVAGAMFFPGFAGFVAGGTAGGGTVAGCFNAFAGSPGPCVTAFGATPSAMAAGVVPGFAIVGAEVGRSVGIEAAIPEPGTAALVALGLAGLAAVGRRRTS